jgi:glycosyltransferase involved in cell wall biosynthesis
MYIFDSMKILQLCNKVPYPEKDGGALGISVFTRELLRAGHSVKMLAMNTSKHYVDINSIPNEFKTSTSLETVDLDNAINPIKALITLLKGESYNISRFNSKAYADKLEQVLKKESFDIIQLEGLYLAPYITLIRQLSKAPIVMRASNIEWKIWEGLANEERQPLKKWYLKILTKQLRRYEEKAVNACDGIITFTTTDLNFLKSSGCNTPVAHVPFGIDTERYIPAQVNDSKSLSFIGALDWMPNLQGLEWFLQNVWNKVHYSTPEAKLHIAGRNMPDKLKNSNYAGVTFYGEIEDAIDFMNKYSIMLVPLFAGSGVRIKIIEGMALGRAIITTTVGINGIDCNLEKDVMVADTPDQFYKTIVYCMQNPDLVKQLGCNGRSFVKANYDIKRITQTRVGFYNERIKGKIPA